MRFNNKIIMLTGAARGLGRELALLLDQEGCSLILIDRDAGGLSDLVKMVSREHQTVTCDLSSVEERKRLIELWCLTACRQNMQKQASALQKVDVLINCAGVGSHSQLSQLSVDEIEYAMQVNALAPLELTAGLSPLELIVNIGSVAGEMNLPSMSLYAASKTSLHAFTRAIQLEGARTLLVILGPLSGTDFMNSVVHPRTGQPKWYRDLDLPAKKAARLIVRAMQHGQSQLVAPWWYGIVFAAWRVLSPLSKWFYDLTVFQN